MNAKVVKYGAFLQQFLDNFKNLDILQVACDNLTQEEETKT